MHVGLIYAIKHLLTYLFQATGPATEKARGLNSMC